MQFVLAKIQLSNEWPIELSHTPVSWTVHALGSIEIFTFPPPDPIELPRPELDLETQPIYRA